MFEVWMMTTNFFICLAAVTGTLVALRKPSDPPVTVVTRVEDCAFRCDSCLERSFEGVSRPRLHRAETITCND